MRQKLGAPQFFEIGYKIFYKIFYSVHKFLFSRYGLIGAVLMIPKQYFCLTLTFIFKVTCHFSRLNFSSVKMGGSTV